MIDYDKLNYAHDLTEKYYERTKIMTWIKIMISSISDLIGYQWTALHDCLLKCEDIDELIEKLEEMTMPKPKYALNSTAYALANFKAIIELTIVRSYVTGIKETFTIYVTDLGDRYAESDVYPTREALIDAQVEYWQKLRCQDGLHAFCVDADECEYCDMKSPYKTQTVNKITIADRKCPKCDSIMSATAGRLTEDSPWIISCSNVKCHHIEELKTPETVKVRGVERAVSEFDSCTHEHDASKARKLMYTPSEMGWVYAYACKHCGEFFNA